MVGLVCVRYERDYRSYDPVGRPPIGDSLRRVAAVATNRIRSQP